MRRSPLLAVLALAAPSFSQGPSHWTVSPDGTGDFLDVASAVAAVAPGDVLLIAPGSYGPTVVYKPLTLIGDPDQPRPTFPLLRFDGIARFDALHLDAERVEVAGVDGLSELDDVTTRALELSGHLDLRVSRSRIEPAPSPIGETAVFLLGIPGQPAAARVRFVDCVIRGGRGLGYVDLGTLVPGHGGIGIFAGFAEVLIAGTSVSGGHGTSDALSTGSGGTGIVAAGCGIELRGSAHDEIEGGLADPDLSVFVTGVPIDASTTCSVTWSGVELIGVPIGPVTQVPDQPYLEISGADGPGARRTIELYAPLDGAAGVVALAAAPAFDVTVAPALGAPLEIALGSMLGTVVLLPAGQDQAASKAFSLPATATLAGIDVFAQALLIGGPKARLTNAVAVLLAF